MGAERIPCPTCGSRTYVKLFVCDICKCITHSDKSDEQARAEYEATFGEPFDPNAVGQCCDNCWEEIKP